MGITRPPTEINTAPAANIFLVEFLTPDARLVAVSPLYVVGVEEGPNGVSIRTARGAVADQFFVRGPAREVVDRLRACWDRAQDSFLASFMRSDAGAVDDRMMRRMTDVIDAGVSKGLTALSQSIPSVVRSEIEKLAGSDANAAPVGTPVTGKPVKRA